MSRTKVAVVEIVMDNDDQIRHRIVEGARRCFNKHGVGKVTIEDIAKASKIARSGVYRYFSTRQEIVEAAIIARLTELIVGLAPLMSSAKSFAEALVIGSMATVDAGRHDPELQQMIGPQGDIQIVDLLAGPSPVAHHIVLDFWMPIFDRGRAEGELRADVSADEAIEWMRGVYLMLILRKELDPKHERNLLEKFLLHSLLTPAALEARANRRNSRNGRKSGQLSDLAPVVRIS